MAKEKKELISDGRSVLRKKSRHAAAPPGGNPGDFLVKNTEKDFEFGWGGALQAGGTHEKVVTVPNNYGDFLYDFNNFLSKTFISDVDDFYFYYPKENVTRLWIGPKARSVGSQSGYVAKWNEFHLLIQEDIDGGTWPDNIVDLPAPIGRLPKNIHMRIQRGYGSRNEPVALREGVLAVNVDDKALWVGNSQNVPVLINGHQRTDVNTWHAYVVGEGNIWDDVNSMNFGGHPASDGTRLNILVNDVWFFTHKGITSVFTHRESVDTTIGLGGDYETTPQDFYAIQGSPVQDIKVRYEFIDAVTDLPNDVNTKDFSGNIGSEGTAQRISPDEVWFFFYKKTPYIWVGLTDVTIGLGGDYVTTDDDYLPLVNVFDVRTFHTTVIKRTRDFVRDFNLNSFSHPQANPDGSLNLKPESVWYFGYNYDNSLRVWLGPKDISVGANGDYIASVEDFLVMEHGVGTRAYTISIPRNGQDNLVDAINVNDFTGHPLANPNGSLVMDPEADFIFNFELGQSYTWVGGKSLIIGGAIPQYTVISEDLSEISPLIDEGYF